MFSYRCNLIPENNTCNELLLYKHYVEDTVDTSILGLIDLNTIDEVLEEEICRLFFRVIVCFYEFPPCDTNSSKLLTLCPERCWELHRIFEICGKFVNFIIINFNCSIPQTYYGNAHVAVSNTSCSKSLKCIKQIIYKWCVYVHTHAHAYIHSYICTYIYTHTHTHIYIIM